MHILEDLFNGDIGGLEKYIKDNSEYKKTNKHLSELSHKLISSLNNEELNIFNDIDSTYTQLAYISEKECFIKGFCVGMKMMLEIITYESPNFIWKNK